MRTSLPTDEQKKAVWEAYSRRQPTRVPLRWTTNTRVVLLNPALNPEGFDFATYCHDPEVHLTVQARHQEYVATELNQTCDSASALPEHWTFYVDNQLTETGAFYGGQVRYRAGQTPAVEHFLTAADIPDFLAGDWQHPLDNPYVKARLAFYQALVRAAAKFTHRGRKGTVGPFNFGLNVGHLTSCVEIFGTEFLALMAEEPEKAQAVLRLLHESSLHRVNELNAYHGVATQRANRSWFADDSIQLISTAMHAAQIMPWHRRQYAATNVPPAAGREHFIHLCGDATRHFPLLRDQLAVTSFDTGFPVDFAWLRETLGPAVEISGGPRADLLLHGTPGECHEQTRAILTSGIMRGGRFVLQEANNLPPCTPLENLRAVYDACQEFGRYDTTAHE